MSTYKDYNKRYFEANKDKWREASAKARSTREGQMKSQFQVCRSRAKKAGLEFDIELEDILSCPDVCPVLGIEIKYGEGRNSHHSPSIDRFDCTLGYIKGNVRMISNRANTLKRDGTLKEFECIIRYLSNI